MRDAWSAGTGLEFAVALCDDVPIPPRTPGLRAAFEDILEAAERAGVCIVVIGALARSVYVRPRTTDGADFLVRDAQDLRTLLAEAAVAFDVPQHPDLVCRLRHRPTGREVDLIVAEYRFELEAMEQAEVHRAFGRSVRVISADTLAAMKIDAAGDPNRPLDFGEVVQLILERKADPERVRAVVERDLQPALPTFERILRAVERARAAPPRPPRGRSRRG